jgi:ribosomal-protein-serine acetyltransferase
MGMSHPILIDLPEQLTGARLLVRPYAAGDGPAVFEAVEESREHLLPWLPWGPNHKCVEDTEAMARTWRARWDQRDDLTVGLWRLSDRRYLGGSGLHRIDWHVRSFEIGYWIRKSEQGKGYVTEAASLLVNLAFETLEANRVFIRCAIGNDRSAAIPERLGFHLEGVLRSSNKDAQGVLRDMRVFGMTRADWFVNAGS